MSDWILDFSLSLVNRTGAFYLTRDLKDALVRDLSGVRTWRDHRDRPYSRIERKVRARLMLKELGSPGLAAMLPYWSRVPDRRYLHMDPLYVLNDKLTSSDRVLCHDIGPVSHPQIYGDGTREMYGRAYEKIARVRPSMTFVSNATKEAFVSKFGSDFPSLDVIPLYLRDDLLGGAFDVETEVPEPEIFGGVSNRFFISVGEVGARKGQADAIRGYAHSDLAKTGVDYVICGPRGFGYDEVFDLASKTRGVHLFSYVSDAELNWLYARAEAFVLLTRLEGFGIPAIEAPLKGVYPILSNDPAVQEVTGGLAPGVESSSTEAVAQALKTALSMSPESREKTVDLIAGFSRRFTFEAYLNRWREVLGLGPAES